MVVVLASTGVSLFEIKRQLQRVYRLCRKCPECPDCKTQQDILQKQVDDYANQLYTVNRPTLRDGGDTTSTVNRP